MDEFEKIYNDIFGGDSRVTESPEPDYDGIPEDAGYYADAFREESYEGPDYFHQAGNFAEPLPGEAPAYYEEPAYPEEEPVPEPAELESPAIVEDDNYRFEPEDFFDGDYENYDDLDDELDDAGVKSFGSYLSSRIAGLFLKIRGNVPSDVPSQTVEEDAEELGKEVPLLYASKYYGSQIYSLRLRFRLSLVFFAILAYISLGGPVPGQLNNLRVAVVSCLALQLTVIMLCLDVFTNGLLNTFRGRFGADSLAAIFNLLTMADALMVLTENCVYHMPLCALSAFSLIGVLFSSVLASRAMRKALRVPAISKTLYAVTSEEEVTGKDVTLLKSDKSIDGFVRRIEEEPYDEATFRKLAPVFAVLAAVLAFGIAFISKSYSEVLYVVTVLLAPAVPFAALLCYALPYYIGTHRIFSSGAAIAGWSGLVDIGNSRNLIVTDRDLFPPDCVEITNVRIFADCDSNRIIAYAGLLVAESKCGLAPAFAKLMEENGCESFHVDNFEPLAGGGFKGMIEGHNILCGSSDLMRLMNVKIPAKLIERTSVLLAMDGVLYGIFNIRYKPDAKVRRALVALMRSNRHPIFAIRDFNVTPDMIHDCFDVATDGYDFPPYAERYPLSEAKPSRESQIAGVVCREGLGPLTVLADTGRNLYVTVRMCTVLTVICVFAGILMAAVKLLLTKAIPLWMLFVWMAGTAVPILILGLMGTSYD